MESINTPVFAFRCNEPLSEDDKHRREQVWSLVFSLVVSLVVSV